MDELILASLQELCMPPGSTSCNTFPKQPALKRTYKKHGSASTKRASCQVAGCEHTLVTAYAKKYRVCNVHVKSPQVHIHDDVQRFCQKCSRFHPVAEFDGYRRTCRIRLAQHNTRRRLIRAMQRADRESSPAHSSGEEVKVRIVYPPRTHQQVPHDQQQTLLAAAPQQSPPPQLPSRPAAGASDMHTALLEVVLARLQGSDADALGGAVDDPSRQPAEYNPYSSFSVPPTAPSSAIPAVYRPPSLSLGPAISFPQYHQNQLLQQVPLPSGGEAEAEAMLNSVDPQQLVHMLQLIISLQQMGCTLDQLEHPEVLPLMISLLQTV
ncbi:hypothetical protein Ndes2526B_g00695 [Nannochloris sp. 'desiccata']